LKSKVTLKTVFQNPDSRLGMLIMLVAVIAPFFGILSDLKDGLLFNTYEIGAFVMLFSFCCIPIFCAGLIQMRKGIRDLRK
jgi:hypothetical protein